MAYTTAPPTRHWRARFCQGIVAGHVNQAAVGGPPLAPAPCSPKARSESVPKSELEIFSKRWKERKSAVDDVQHMAYGVNKKQYKCGRCGKVGHNQRHCTGN